MFGTRSRVLTLLATLAGSAIAPAASAQLVSLPSAFTYQGRLTDGGTPASGAYDLRFVLYTAATGGAALGPTLTVEDVAVAGGLFTTRLDFGDQYNGDPRWLEIQVRPGASVGPFTTLNPRQELTAAPYALGPWQVVTDQPYPRSGYFLNSGGGSYFGIDSVNGDLHMNGGADGVAGIFSEGVATGRFEIITGSPAMARLAVANSTGNVGINTTAPAHRLHVSGAPQDQFTFVVQNRSSAGGNAIRGVVESNGSGNFSSGVVGLNLAPAGPAGSFGMYAEHTGGGTGIRAIGSGPAHGVEGYATGVNGWGGYFKNTAGGVALFADGVMMVRTLQILGGADLAEPFDVASPGGEAAPEPGMVVVIDPTRPGDLVVSTTPYDTKVAGIISGANGLEPGMVMKAQGTEHADGAHPVALTGRVWCHADADAAPIRPGDLLTTSSVPGHAMRADDASRSGGAVIGKAMTGLEGGRGMVLVLVNLQ